MKGVNYIAEAYATLFAKDKEDLNTLLTYFVDLATSVYLL